MKIIPIREYEISLFIIIYNIIHNICNIIYTNTYVCIPTHTLFVQSCHLGIIEWKIYSLLFGCTCRCKSIFSSPGIPQV
jgi:hypothetical protein